MWYPSYKSRRKRALSNIVTSPFRGRQINKRNIRQYIIHSALPNIQKLLINISINFQKRWLTFETQPKDENPLGSAALRLHADGSNNMRYPIFSTFKKSELKYWEARSKSFAGRQICVFASIQLTGRAQNETNFHVKTNIPCTASALSKSRHFIWLIIRNFLLPDKFVSRPYFGDTETVITVQQGEAAFFNCQVFNLANQTVSFYHRHRHCHRNQVFSIIFSRLWNGSSI